MRLLTTFRALAPVVMATLALTGSARAEQIVLFDTTYTHTNANDSHHSISGPALNQPMNWTAPIDYTQGTIHFYQEVMTKPSNKPTIIDFCLISQRDYGCIETFIYTTVGLNETVRSMAGKDVDKRAVIDFTKPMRSIQMVLKTPAPTYINGGSPQSDFLPSKMRFVATLVSPGGTYQKPTPTPGFNPGDGGAAVTPVTPDAAAASPDAGAPATADAAEPVDPPVTPPAKADAAAADPKPPTTKVDAAASKPPTMTDPPGEPDPDPAPAARKSGGCTVGGSGSGGGLFLGLLLLATLRRRRR